MTPREQDEKRAFQRHMALSVIRLMGAGFIVAGLLACMGRLAFLGDTLAVPVGVLLIVNGIVDFAILPP
ncbi:MAG: hypothetical protein RLZZ58_1498, partial [Pseudomonadota bacterium]